MEAPAHPERVSALDGGIASRLAAIHVRIRQACERSGRDPDSVTLIGVAKTQPLALIREAWEAGLRDIGENYIQEAVVKIDAMAPGERPAFHFIGHLQTNKARLASGRFAILHGIDSERLLNALSAASSAAPQPIMLQVNLGDEASKHGVAPAALAGLVGHARSLPGIELRGLMTIPPASDDGLAGRPWFRDLHALAKTFGLEGLSMGMSGDFETAIEEGATHIRVGRAIFGERGQR